MDLPLAPPDVPSAATAWSPQLRPAGRALALPGVAARRALAVVGLYAGPALAVAAALGAWRGVSYWEYSEGVYALTARMLADGTPLYTELVAAQPPPLFYLGVAALALGDSIEALRAAMSIPYLATGLLVALAVWRLTESRAAAVGGGLAALVTPWTLHDGATLLPETFAAPLLLGAALLAGGRWTRAGGAVAALAASFKLAFLLPAVALGLAARARRAYLTGLVAALGVLWVVFLATHGSALIENVFLAQWQTGPQAPARLSGLWLQAAWNLAPLVVLAAIGWRLGGGAARDRALLTRVAVLATGSAALLITLLKHGSYLNVLVVAEPPLVVLGAAGVWWLLDSLRRPGGTWGSWPGAVGRRVGAAAGALALALLVAQSGSLLASPDAPGAFARPLSDAPHGRGLSSAEVRALAARPPSCAARADHGLTPYLAFVAGRPMPGGQPDRFILKNAGLHAPLRQLADARAATGCTVAAAR